MDNKYFLELFSVKFSIVLSVVKCLNTNHYKNGSAFMFGDKMWVGVHRLSHITGK